MMCYALYLAEKSAASLRGWASRINLFQLEDI